MSNFFNMDNGLFRALGKLADLMLLNILFLVCSLPIFTIGASFTAMYYVTLKLAENEEGYIARGFWKSFKQNFKQATIIWLILLFFGIVLVLDLLILKDSTGTFVTVLRVVITELLCHVLIAFFHVADALLCAMAVACYYINKSCLQKLLCISLEVSAIYAKH